MLRLLLCSCALAVCVSSVSFAQQTTADSAAKAARSAVMVNLNTATAMELETLPGIGPKVAARIIEYRQKNGPFKKIEEIMNVQGVGEKSFLRLRPQLTVAAKADTAGQH